MARRVGFISQGRDSKMALIGCYWCSISISSLFFHLKCLRRAMSVLKVLAAKIVIMRLVRNFKWKVSFNLGRFVAI